MWVPARDVATIAPLARAPYPAISSSSFRFASRRTSAPTTFGVLQKRHATSASRATEDRLHTRGIASARPRSEEVARQAAGEHCAHTKNVRREARAESSA